MSIGRIIAAAGSIFGTNHCRFFCRTGDGNWPVFGLPAAARVQVRPLPGIVRSPLRFYEAAVTGRANSERSERRQTAGAQSRRFPSSASVCSEARKPKNEEKKAQTLQNVSSCRE